VGLKGFGDKRPWQLSGGMLQRASLCRALIHEPQLLLLDEPFGALDQFTREELWAALQQLWMERKPTVLLVTHDLREAATLANRICVMSARPGRILEDRLVPFARPRTVETSYAPEVATLVQALRLRIAERAQWPMNLPPNPSRKPRMTLTAANPPAAAVGAGAGRLLCAVGAGLPGLRHQRPDPAAAQPDRHVLVQKMPLLWPHTVQTLSTTLLGFALGVAVGILLGRADRLVRLAYDVAYPLLVGFSSIPKVAVVPIFVVWFGAGTVPAVLTSMVISIFPVVVNVATGLASTEPELEDVLKVLGASKRDVLFNVSLPRALPYLFASLKIAITLAFVGTVLSETVAANKGIGNVMMIASGNFDVPMVFAGLVILAVMGVLLYMVSSFIENRMTGWAQRKNDFAMV
jgi:NitT/TauT family transport system permease protein